MHPLEYWDNQRDLGRVRIKRYKKLNAIVGKRLKSQRKAAMLTQAELAEKLGVTRTSISNMEKGITVFNFAKCL